MGNIKNWALPDKFHILKNLEHTICVVSLTRVRKYYEKMGYTFTECPNYLDEKLANGCSYPERGIAIDLIELLGYRPECLYVPDKQGLALIPFGNEMAIAIAPRIDTED
jgi:hypothetical protein